MANRIRVNRVTVAGFSVSVIVAGAVTASFFGILAADLYVLPIGYDAMHEGTLEDGGLWWGMYAGAVAGVIWCIGMLPIALRGRMVRLGRVGAVLGLGVGSLSTVMLHVGFWLAVGRVELGNLIFGLFFGIPAGAIVGALCGRICWKVVGRAVSVPETAETETAA